MNTDECDLDEALIFADTLLKAINYVGDWGRSKDLIAGLILARERESNEVIRRAVEDAKAREAENEMLRSQKGGVN
jgi:hypothetical protein